MTDLEITKLCAEAMGYTLRARNPGHPFRVVELPGKHYDPLHDDTQAMALLKRFELMVSNANGMEWKACYIASLPDCVTVKNESLSRAICECVARMQSAQCK